MIRDLYRRNFIVCAATIVSLGLCGTAAAQSKPAAAPVILVVGDSLSAEYGLVRGTGWVALLEKKLGEEKTAATIVNASVSGETTSGGRARLAGLVKQHKPDVVVIELGGNDALRGLPLATTEANLSAMAQAAQQAGAKVLLAGMEVPPNYGADYSRRFQAVFAQVAKARQTALVPFLLKGVADGPDAVKLFQPDRIHPKADAHPLMLDNVWPELKKLLK